MEVWIYLFRHLQLIVDTLEEGSRDSDINNENVAARGKNSWKEGGESLLADQSGMWLLHTSPGSWKHICCHRDAPRRVHFALVAVAREMLQGWMVFMTPTTPSSNKDSTFTCIRHTQACTARLLHGYSSDLMAEGVDSSVQVGIWEPLGKILNLCCSERPKCCRYHRAGKFSSVGWIK